MLINYIIFIFLITACGVKDSQHEISLSMADSFKAKQDVEFNAKPQLLQGSNVNFFLFNNPPWLTVDPITGEIRGIPTEMGNFTQIRLAAKNDSTYSGIYFDLDVSGDPLANEEWYIENIGQNSFTPTSGIYGEDMLVKGVHRLGYGGKGVLIGISDTGLEINHEDLKENVSLENSKNYSFYDASGTHMGKDPTNIFDVNGDHGTSVAGIIGAVGWNNLGIRGVSPNSKIAGINFLGYDERGSFQENPNIWLDQLLPHKYDIINQSWSVSWYDNGNYQFYFKKFVESNYIDTIYLGVSEGRAGKGSIYVRAGGNDGNWLTQLRGTDLTARVYLDSNYHQLNTNPYTINVGALSASGKKASYSSPGASLWVSAPGGENGIDEPAIITTDQSGCEKGYAKKYYNSTNTFDTDNNKNPDCNYTSRFNGTSAAAPMVSGVIALMLEANPNLTWRDVKYILASTSDKVDPEFSNRTINITFGDQLTYTIKESGWTKNAAGFHFHNWYGFGRVNAEKAIKMAKEYNKNLGKLKQTTIHNSENCTLEFCNNDDWIYDKKIIPVVAIPDIGEAYPPPPSITIEHNLIIEAVQVRVSITHLKAGDIGLELTSPSGTKSTFLQPSILNETENINDYTFLTNAFLGENSAGEWKLKVFDAIPNYYGGTLTNWKINIIGHSPSD